MDSLTQIVLGAAVGEAVLGKKVGNKAMLWGAIAGTIPDLDVLAQYFVDDLRKNELHRGFSHSILFSILAAPVLGWLVARIHNKLEASRKDWSKLMFWSLFTHPLLDAHTNWGTQLFWPLEYKISYKNIFVADPLYTLPFLVLLIMAMTRKRTDPKRTKYNNWGLAISSSYMVITILFKAITYNGFVKSLERQGIEYIEVETKPTPLNSILWSANVETKDSYLVGYLSLLDQTKEVKFHKFPKNRHLLEGLADEDKVKRLVKLSQGWYTIDRDGDKVFFNDLRFGQTQINSPSAEFVFRYELFYDKGELLVEESPKEIKDFGPVFRTLFERIKGN